MSVRPINVALKGLRKLAPRGVSARLKLARLDVEKRLYRRKVSAREFREGLLSLGEWRDRTVWVQASLNDFYNVDLRPTDILDIMLDLTGPRGTLVMPAFPLAPDPTRELRIDRAPTSTGLLTEMFRRLPSAERSIHLHASVAALGPDSAYLTESHHKDIYPWGDVSPYGRLLELDGLMVGLGVQTLGLTPLHHVECALHHEVPVFQKVFPGEQVTYSWRRQSGETGVHTTLIRHGRLWPGRLAPFLSREVYRRFRLSNLSFQGTAARGAVEAVKVLARRNKTIYVGL